MKFVWFAVGLLLAFLGQSLIGNFETPGVLQPFNTIFKALDRTFYLSFNNPANILAGLFLLIIAAILFSFSFAHRPQTMDAQNLQTDTWSSLKPYRVWIVSAGSVYLLILCLLAFHINSWIIFWAWILSIAAITFVIWRAGNNTGVKYPAAISHRDALWILTLFAFCIAAGSYLLNDHPAGWIADEGPFWKMARSIALGMKHPSFFDVGVFTFPISSSLFQGWVMRWAGIDLWGWRFSSVFASALTIIPLYLLANELFDRRAAIAANVLMIANPYFLAFSRFGYNNSQSLFPVTLCIYFMVIAIRRNNRFYFWLAGLTAGLGFYTYFSAWLGLAVLIVVILSLLIARKLSIRTSLTYLGIIVVGSLIVILPRVIYTASGDSPETLHFKIWETGPVNTFYGRYVFGVERIAESKIIDIGGAEIFIDPQLYSLIAARGVIRTAAGLFNPIDYKDHQIFFGLTGIGSSIFFIIGFVVSATRAKRLQYFIPLIWFLAGFLLLGALTSLPPRPTHLVAIIPALALISAVGVITAADALFKERSQPDNHYPAWNKLLTFGILAILLIAGFFSYFVMIPFVYAPPNEDDYISWLGRQIGEPANIYLIDHYASNRNPLDETINRLTPHHVKSLTIADLEANPNQVHTWENFVAFVPVQTGKAVAEALVNDIPGSKIIPAYSTGQRLRGYIITDLEIDASMDHAFSSGLVDLWNSPARIFLLIFGAGVLALVIQKTLSV